MQMDLDLRPYTAAELRVLPYKKEIDSLYKYIVDTAKDGYETIRIELNPIRNRIVLSHLQKLFPDTSFRYAGISSTRESYGQVIYKVSWNKQTVMNRTEIFPFRKPVLDRLKGGRF